MDSAMGRMPSVFPVPVPATIPNPFPDSRQLTHVGAVLALEERVEVQSESQLDRLTGRPSRRDHDDSARGMGCVAVSVGIGGKMMVAGGMHPGR